MLTPEYLGHVGDHLEKVFYDLETDILCDIAGWLQDNNLEASTTAEYEYWLLKALGTNQKEMNKQIGKVLKVTEDEVEKIMNDSTYESVKKDINVCRKAGIIETGFNFDVSNTVRKHKAGLKQELNNLCDSTAKFANKKLMEVYDKAYLSVSSGLMSYDKAVEEACKDLYKDGIKVVNYQSGHVNHVDTAVRVAVRTGVNQNALACAEELLDELDVNLVEVSSHAGARPSHEEWQGKIFWRKHPEGNYRNFYEATGYGTGAGLGGWNCRHNFWPYFPEVGRTSHDDIPKDVNDRVYELEQEQRYQERQIRGWERRRRIKVSAGQDVTLEKMKVHDWKKKHEQFLKDNSDVLKPYYSRMKVYGGDTLPKQKPNKTPEIQNENMSVLNCNGFFELKEHLKNEYQIEVEESINDLDFDIVKSSLSGFESISKDFPELLKQVNRVELGEQGVAYCSGDVIGLNKEYFADKTLLDVCKSQSEEGKWHRNSNPGSILAHESGHAVEDLLIHLNNEYKEEWQKKLAWNNCKEAEKIVRTASKEMLDTEWGKKTIKPYLQEGYEEEDYQMYAEAEKDPKLIYGFKSFFVSDISEYAKESYSECMAEAFADVYSNGANASPFSRKIKEVTIRLYNEYKKR